MNTIKVWRKANISVELVYRELLMKECTDSISPNEGFAKESVRQVLRNQWYVLDSRTLIINLRSSHLEVEIQTLRSVGRPRFMIAHEQLEYDNHPNLELVVSSLEALSGIVLVTLVIVCMHFYACSV